MEEFVRVLRPGGFAVITFDITLGGKGKFDVSPAVAASLFALLRRHFEEINPPVVPNPTTLSYRKPSIVTSKWVQHRALADPNDTLGLMGSLPWGAPQRNRMIPNLAFSCHLFKKRAS